MSAPGTARAAFLLIVLLGANARAETIGLYAPSAPFEGPVARLEFVSRLAEKVGAGWSGRVYARAADFAAALKRQEIQFAVLDAPYLAALGVPYTVVGSAVRKGQTQASWEVVTSVASARGLLDLRGRVVAIPAIGAREEAFLTQVLLEGELPRDHFARVVYAPDALSALAAVAHGRAEAAIVPAGLPAPAGTRRITTLGQIGWPLLVALPGAEPAAVARVTAALARFGGDVVFERLTPGGADSARALAARFVRPARRGPMATPPLRLAMDMLLGGRTFRIQRRNVTSYATDAAPQAPPPAFR